MFLSGAKVLLTDCVVHEIKFGQVIWGEKQKVNGVYIIDEYIDDNLGTGLFVYHPDNPDRILVIDMHADGDNVVLVESNNI